MQVSNYDVFSFFLMLPGPRRSPLFPYPTLFRSPLAVTIENGQGTTMTITVDATTIRAIFPQDLGFSDPSFNGSGKYLRSEEHTSELQSPCNLVCRPLLEKKRLRFPPH